MVPLAVPRRAVRSMRASISRSIRQFTAKAAAASIQIPRVAATTRPASGSPGVARNMPITAQNTASCVTRGFVSTRYCRSRLCACWLSVVLGNSLLGNIVKTCAQGRAGQNQPGCAPVVEHSDGQWPFKEDGGQPCKKLSCQQCQNQAGRAAQAGGSVEQAGERAEPDKDEESEIAVYPVNAGERILRNHFARGQLTQGAQ